MLAGFHTTALDEHDLETAGALLRRAGFCVIAVRLSRARLDPLGRADDLATQIELLRRVLQDVEIVVDADARFLIDAWSPEIGQLMQEGPARERRIACISGAIDIAARSGAKLVTFATGILARSMDVQTGMDRLRDAILQIAPLAEQAGVTLAVRPRVDHFVDSVGRFERLTEWIGDRADLRLAADVGTMVAGGEMPVVDLLVRSQRLACVYLSDTRLTRSGRSGTEALIGGGHVAADRVVAGLAESRFRGPILVEPARSETVDPHAAAALFERIFGSVGEGRSDAPIPPTSDTL